MCVCAHVHMRVRVSALTPGGNLIYIAEQEPFMTKGKKLLFVLRLLLFRCVNFVLCFQT